MFRGLVEIYQFCWMLESHAQQRLAWQDAVDARHARARSEAQSALQVQAMLTLHPSGALGGARLDDEDALAHAGLV